MRVAIIGSREIGDTDPQEIYKKIGEHLPSSCSEIVSGGAEGVDRIAYQIANDLQIRYTCFLPKYDRFREAAPLKRNIEIINYADCVIAFWNFISNGTRQSIIEAIKTGKPVKIVEL